MDSVEKHIEVDKKILEDPTTNPQQRRHIESAVKDCDIRAVHPEKMEAFADMMVSKLKGAGKHWRTCNNMDD